MKTGKGLAEYAISKLGTPYFYGAKMQFLTDMFAEQMHKLYPKTVTTAYINKAKAYGMFGKVCVDCSGLIGAYRDRHLGSAQLYSTASKRLKMSDINTFPVGTVLWRSGHVAVYIGNMECVEAKGIDYGTVKSKVNPGSWTVGLLFSDMQYDDVVVAPAKKVNPYEAYKPTRIIKKGCQGNDVRWVQYELQEAGYDLDCDGIAGNITDKYIRAFQASAKLIVDGKVGTNTIKALVLN